VHCARVVGTYDMEEHSGIEQARATLSLSVRLVVEPDQAGEKGGGDSAEDKCDDQGVPAANTARLTLAAHLDPPSFAAQGPTANQKATNVRNN